MTHVSKTTSAWKWNYSLMKAYFQPGLYGAFSGLDVKESSSNVGLIEYWDWTQVFLLLPRCVNVIIRKKRRLWKSEIEKCGIRCLEVWKLYFYQVQRMHVIILIILIVAFIIGFTNNNTCCIMAIIHTVFPLALIMSAAIILFWASNVRPLFEGGH